MRDQRLFDVVALVAAIAIVVGLGAVAVLSPASNRPLAGGATGAGSPPTAYRNLSIAFDPTTGTYEYSSAALTVPAGVRVVFTITNFDTGIAVLPTPADADVVGTLGGAMLVATGSAAFTTDQLPTDDVSHTFSLSDSAYHVNVPIPPASAPGVPVQVTFAVVFDVYGTFTWGCVVLCGTEGMQGPDSMYGTLSVV
jgi:hypothetical protein